MNTTNHSDRAKYNIISFLCIIIFVISWITNIGWIRVLYAIPMLIHAAVFYFANNYFRKYHQNSDNFNAVNYCVYASYLLFYILLPDGGDTADSSRVVFGLVKNQAFISVLWFIAELLCVINIILIAIQFVHTYIVKLQLNGPDERNESSKIAWYKKWWVWVTICVSIIAIFPYTFIFSMVFPDAAIKDNYRGSQHIATITVTNYHNQKEYIVARELIESRTKWVHNQKSDWDRYGRRRSYSLDLSKSDEIRVFFGFEKDFDIDTFANEIINAANLVFIDSNNNHIINSDEIVSVSSVYQGETNSRDVIIKMTEVGMREFLSTAERADGLTQHIQINFNGSIPSDYFTVKSIDYETIIIGGFINSGAAESLVKLIELKDIPKDLNVELKKE